MEYENRPYEFLEHQNILGWRDPSEKTFVSFTYGLDWFPAPKCG